MREYPGVALLYVSEIGCSGYALAAREYILALRSHHTPLTWCPITWTRGPADPYRGPCSDPVLESLRTAHSAYDRSVLHILPTMHADWMTRIPPVAYTVWETDRLPSCWVERLNQVDRVLVPCTWNREVFQASGVRVPIHVVPHIVPEDLEDLRARPCDTPFTFYTVAPWTRRKALDLLVEAYLRAFPSGERVRLVLKTGARDRTLHSQAWGVRHLINLRSSTARTVARLKARHRRPAPIELLTGDLDRSRILQLHRNGHCFVSLSRGEGWGLGIFEAAAAGVPVICPGFGGQMDYLDSDLSYLVDYRLVACSVGPWERQFGEGEQRWAEPEIDHAVQRMRQVYENYSEARERATVLLDRVRRRFSREAVLPALLEGIC